MARTVKEWQGATDDAAIPASVRLRIFERCAGKCALTGRKIGPGDEWDLDHETPLSMGGRHAESNLRVVWRPAHREKTAKEATSRAKADRVRKKHLGIATKSRRGFRGWRKMNGEIVWRGDR